MKRSITELSPSEDDTTPKKKQKAYLDDCLVCHICYHKYNGTHREPMIYGCGHTHCKDCTNKMTKCPECRRTIGTPAKNFLLRKIVVSKIRHDVDEIVRDLLAPSKFKGQQRWTKEIDILMTSGDETVYDALVEGVVKGMRAHVLDAGVQERMMKFFAVGINKIRDALVRCGGVDAIVKGMRAHVGVANVQKNGTGALANLAAGSNDIRDAIVRDGGLDAIVKAMHAHVCVGIIQQKGGETLMKLATGSNDRKDAIVRSGGFDAMIASVVASMRGDVRNARSQRMSMLLLNKLIILDGIPICDIIVAGGGVDAIVAGMRAHVGVADVQEAGAAVLSTICSKGRKDAVVSAGGLDAILGVTPDYVRNAIKELTRHEPCSICRRNEMDSGEGHPNADDVHLESSINVIDVCD